MKTRIKKSNPVKVKNVDGLLAEGKLLDYWEKPKRVQSIIISETEEIEVGDKYLCPNGTYDKCHKKDKEYVNGEGEKREFFKILALPENISPEILEEISEGKLKDGDKVLVVCETKAFDEKNKPIQYAIEQGDYTIIQIKLDSKNHINLFPVKQEPQNEKVKVVRNPDENDGVFIYGDNFEKALARIYPNKNQEEIAKRFVTAVNMHDELITRLRRNHETLLSVYNGNFKELNLPQEQILRDEMKDILKLIEKSEQK